MCLLLRLSDKVGMSGTSDSCCNLASVALVRERLGRDQPLSTGASATTHAFFRHVTAGVSLQGRVMVRRNGLFIETIKASVISMDTKIVHWKCRGVNGILFLLV